jgi:hypothetical protein
MLVSSQYSRFDPRATNIGIIHNRLHVNGRPLPIRPPDRIIPQMLHKGFYYETPHELAFAKILTGQCINKFHHPRFSLIMPDGSKSVWSPDFVFTRTFLLDVADPKRQIPIHGIELKCSLPGPGILLRQQLLIEQYNVHIHILSEPQVGALLVAGEIPLQPVIS